MVSPSIGERVVYRAYALPAVFTCGFGLAATQLGSDPSLAELGSDPRPRQALASWTYLSTAVCQFRHGQMLVVGVRDEKRARTEK